MFLLLAVLPGAQADDLCLGNDRDPDNYTRVCPTNAPGGGHDRASFVCVESYSTDGYNEDYERVCAASYHEEGACIVGGENYHGNPGESSHSYGCLVGTDRSGSS